MKKFFVFLSVIILLCLNSTVSYAECNCTSDEIVSKLENLRPIEKDSFLRDFLYSSLSSSKERIVEEIEDTRAFRNALKSYINSNCSISNNKIVCR